MHGVDITLSVPWGGQITGILNAIQYNTANHRDNKVESPLTQLVLISSTKAVFIAGLLY